MSIAPTKLADYLHYLELDDYGFEAMPQNGNDSVYMMGCSSFRKGDLYGRNLDLNYCDIPEFIVRLTAAEGRLASISVCPDISGPSEVSDMTDDDYLLLPNLAVDGINEKGVVINVNVVDPTGVDDRRGTAPGKEKVHSTRMVRYLLDRAESARHAVELMRGIDIIGGFRLYGLHWMIADEHDTFVVEIIGGKLVVSENERFIMTNFYDNYGPIEPEQFVAGIRFTDVPLLNEYAIGVERWCLLRDGYEGVSSAEDVASLLEQVKGSYAYDRTQEPIWLTECTGGALSIHSDRADFEACFERQVAHFEARDRKNPQGDWNTWHSTVYDIKARSMRVYSQEDYSVCYEYVMA